MVRVLFSMMIFIVLSGAASGESLGKPKFPTKSQQAAQEAQESPKPLATLPLGDLVKKQDMAASTTKIGFGGALLMTATGIAVSILPGNDTKNLSICLQVGSLVAGLVGLFGFFDYLDSSVAISKKLYEAQEP